MNLNWYKTAILSSSPVGWILGNGDILPAPQGHAEAVYKNPAKFNITDFNSSRIMCSSFKSGAVRYHRLSNREEFSIEGAKESIMNHIDIIEEMAGNDKILVDVFDTSSCSSRPFGTFLSASELYDSL